MSELYALTVPKWGMSMEEGEIAEWHVAVGDSVAVGDGLVDIETSKIINTAECTCSGTLVRIVGQPGDVLQVGDLLGVVADGAAAEQQIDAFVAAFVPDAAAAALAESPAERPAVAAAAPAVPASAGNSAAPDTAALAEGPDDSEVRASPVARRIARAHKVNLHNVAATGRNGRVSKRDVEQAAGIRVQAAVSAAAAAPAQPARSTADDSHIPSTPVARRTARELNINLHDVTATGKRGRVTKEDVANAARALTGASSYREIRLDGMRRTIATRLSQSKQSIPHYRVSTDIEIDSLLQQRRYMNEELGHSLSVNDFVIKACAVALARVPEVNVQFAGDCIRQFDQVDIAMAVAIDGGLITPVVRDVGSKGLPQLSAEASELARRAQAGSLGIDDIQGGTFSISNLGMYGVAEFDAIINPPQAAILAVAAGRQQPVACGGAMAIATVMRVTLSSDHRVIDGAVAARFLQALKGLLENPASMLL